MHAIGEHPHHGLMGRNPRRLELQQLLTAGLKDQALLRRLHLSRQLCSLRPQDQLDAGRQHRHLVKEQWLGRRHYGRGLLTGWYHNMWTTIINMT